MPPRGSMAIRQTAVACPPPELPSLRPRPTTAVEPRRAAPGAGDGRHGRRLPAAPRRVHRLHHRVADPRRREPGRHAGLAVARARRRRRVHRRCDRGRWLTRRRARSPPSSSSACSLVEAALIAAGAAVAAWQGIDDDAAKYVVIALLAIAMGFQTAAIRFVHVPEIPIAAATLATFGVVVGLTGEHGDRTALLRRVRGRRGDPRRRDRRARPARGGNRGSPWGYDRGHRGRRRRARPPLARADATLGAVDRVGGDGCVRGRRRRGSRTGGSPRRDVPVQPSQ